MKNLISIFLALLFMVNSSGCSKVAKVNNKLIQSNTSEDSLSTEINLLPENEFVFIGDSVCSGLYTYPDLLKPTQVFAEVGMNIVKCKEHQFKYHNQKYSLSDLLHTLLPKTIYVWIGYNDLWRNEDNFTKTYTEFVDIIKSASPDSKIIILSLTPVRNNKTITNAQITTANIILKNTFDNNEHTSFLSIHNDFLDPATNMLYEQLDGGDGLHLNAKAYSKLLDILKIEH